MDEESLFDFGGVLAFQVIDQFEVVTMATESIDGEDLSRNSVFVAENGNRLGTRCSQQFGS